MRATALLLVASHWLAAGATAQHDLALHYATFDPVRAEPPLPAVLWAAPGNRLHLVQARGEVDAAFVDALRGAGARPCWYVPHHAYVVRMDAAAAPRVRALPQVRWTGPFHPAFKLAPDLLGPAVDGALPAQRYDLVVAAPGEDGDTLARALARIGGTLELRPGRGPLAVATLDHGQLLRVAHLDEVVWVDRAGAPEEDLDIARTLGGANAIELWGGHTGKGIRGHVLEGIEPGHPEFGATAYRGAPVGVFSTNPSSHGTQTYGIVFSRGVVPQARGILPDAQGFFTDLGYVLNQNTRYTLVQALVDPAQPYQVVFQTASWGYPRTNLYTSRTAEMDAIIFDHDIPICQANGADAGNNARPTSWAKNVLGIGGFVHFDNLNFHDDCWCGAGAKGPAADGRIKPELSHFADALFTAAANNRYANFGGTSASTPLVAGHVGLSIELFTDGLFGYPAAPGWQSRFAYRPHFTTTKALVVNTARQHFFAGANHDMARNHQGWGMPDVARLFQQARAMLVVDEQTPLRQGERATYWTFVPAGTDELRATMTHAEPPALPAAAITRINSLDLRVQAPDGTVYWGNQGLAANMFSTPGGSANDRDTLENVWLQSPAPGLYQVEVAATAIRQDAHVETAALDADFALVVSGLAGLRDDSGLDLTLAAPAPGQLSLALARVPAGIAGGFTLLTLAVPQPLGNGALLGITPDATTAAILAQPAAVGNPFHFTATALPGAYPNAPYAFPTSVALALQGLAIDAVAVVYDAQGQVVAVSDVARV